MFGNASFHFKCIWIKSQHWWNWRKTFNEPNFKRFLISSAYVNLVFWEAKKSWKNYRFTFVWFFKHFQIYHSPKHVVTFFHPYLWHFDSIGWIFSYIQGDNHDTFQMRMIFSSPCKKGKEYYDFHIIKFILTYYSEVMTSVPRLFDIQNEYGITFQKW